MEIKKSSIKFLKRGKSVNCQKIADMLPNLKKFDSEANSWRDTQTTPCYNCKHCREYKISKEGSLIRSYNADSTDINFVRVCTAGLSEELLGSMDSFLASVDKVYEKKLDVQALASFNREGYGEFFPGDSLTKKYEEAIKVPEKISEEGYEKIQDTSADRFVESKRTKQIKRTKGPVFESKKVY